MSFNRSIYRIAQPFLALLLLVLLSGCTSLRKAPAPDPMPLRLDTISFSADAERVDVVDAAATALLANNFTLSLLNERIGLVQTDFIALNTLPLAEADGPALDGLTLRVAVNVDHRAGEQFVQLRGTLQRMDGAPHDVDEALGRYWLEQLTADVADVLGVDYRSVLTERDYADALDAFQARPQATKPRFNTTTRAIGIVAAIMFTTTLAAGALGPSGSR